MRIRRIAVPRALWFSLLAAAVLLAAAPQAAAQRGVLTGLGDFTPPTADGTALEDFAVPHIGYSFWVTERGVYTIFAQRDTEPFPGRLLLHRGPIDLDDPLDRLIEVADFDEAGEGATFEVLLEAGVIYYLSATLTDPDATGIYDFVYPLADGPGESRLSACIPPDDHTETVDYGEALELSEEFCAEIDWRDHQGNTGTGTTVPYRSIDSGMFWFFNPNNWEILLKVLDGCAVNGHYWVFYAATTDVEFDLYVTPRTNGYRTGRVYHNDLGNKAETVTNTVAFPCE